jgi:hypothetical protein
MKKTHTRKATAGAPAATSLEGDRRIAKLLSTLQREPEFLPVVQEFEKSRGRPGRTFGSNGLKVNGKLFALFTQGTLVLKLPKERVAALVDEGLGKCFDPGHGRLMKEWLTVTSPKASWVALAKQAYAFVSRMR